MKNGPTIAQVVDYLSQFPPETEVVFSEDEVRVPGEFVLLNQTDLDWGTPPSPKK